VSKILGLDPKKLREYDNITKMSKIARRYFVMNAFDGALTIFGVIIGAYLADLHEPRLLLVVGASTAVAVGISGLWGAFLTESAEREMELRELEKKMMKKLRSTEIAEANRAATIIAALVDGLSPSLAAFFILIPFAAAGMGFVSMADAYADAIILSFVSFFMLGVFLGKISKGNMLSYGLKMLFAGLVCAVVSYFFGVA